MHAEAHDENKGQAIKQPSKSVPKPQEGEDAPIWRVSAALQLARQMLLQGALQPAGWVAVQAV